MKLSPVVLGLCAFVLGLTAAVSAQEKPAAAPAKAAITGTVSDETGAALGSATVTADNGAGVVSSVTTDAQGQYAVTDLTAGSYAITVVARGAKIFQASVTLSPGQVLMLSVAGAPVAQPNAAPPSAAPTQAAPNQAAPNQAAPAPAPNASTPAPPAAPNSTPPSAPNPTAPAPVTNASTPDVAAQPNSTPPQAAAQGAPEPTGGSDGGSIGGAVNDQTGAVVVAANVKISGPAGFVKATTSDDKGNYAFKGLPAGSYNITVTAPGFKTFEADAIALTTGQNLPFDVGLEPAGEKTEVTVEGQRVAQVETENAQVSGTITEKEVLTLGLNGRNFTQLIALTPGVSNQTGQDEAKVGVTGSVKYSVNGGRVEYNTFEVDSSDVLNAGLNGAESTLMVYPSLDAIQEVKVLTSNYGAMYGRTASGTVMVTTKSGTPKWHGDGYEFLRNEAFNGRNYFDQTKKAPLYRRNDFGGTIGGPLYIPNVYNNNKDKTFFFWSEEFRFEKSPTDLQPDFNRGVPSLAERHGDFNDVCPANNDPTSPSPGIFSRAQWPDCPAAGITDQFAGYLVAFPDNIIPPIPNGFGALDPNALALLNTNLIPLPNSSTGCNSTIGSCYDEVISEPTTWREELFRIDHNINSKLQATFRYIHDAWQTTVPVPQWSYLHLSGAQDSFPTIQNKFVGPGIDLVARLTHTITPSLLNEFTASYANSHITLSDVNGPGGADYQRPAGIGVPGGPPTTLTNSTISVTSYPMGAIFNNGFGGKVPGLVIGGNNLEYGGAGFAVDPSYMPWEHTNPTYSYRDDVSKVIKSHTLQFGAQLIFVQRNQTNDAIGANTGDIQGLLTFSNINGGQGDTGNAFANFLTLRTAGNVNAIRSYTQDSAQGRYYNRYRIGEPYIQDDWKVNSRLTVNLGMRFSLFGLYHEKYLREYNWDPSAFSPALAAQVSVDPTTGHLLSRSDGAIIPINLQNPDPRILNGLVLCGVNYVPAGCMKGHTFNPAPRIGVAWDPFGNGKTSIRAGYGVFFEHGTGEEANTGSLEASAPYVLNMTQNLPESYGCVGGSAGTDPTCQPGAYPINVTAIPTKAVWPYAQQWSLSVQRELPKSMVATIAYVGSKGTHLTVERQLNQLKPLPENENPFGVHEPLIPEPTVAGQGDCVGYSPTAKSFQLLNGTIVGSQDPAYINLIAACAGGSTPTPDVNTLRPYPGLGQIFSLQNVADSSYNALQATIRRTKGPLTVGASYSYSHSIDDSSDRSDATFVNSYDLRANRANSNFDQRHLLNVSYIYNVPNLSQALQRWTSGHTGEPTGDGQDLPISSPIPKVLHFLGDGWEISGITIFQSGTPFSVINGGSSTISVLDNAGVANGIGAGSYPDVVKNPGPSPDEQQNTRSFGPLIGNPNMFVAPRGLTFGDAGRNILNNPHRTNFDLSVLKHFPVREGSVVEFRAEAFNLFNHTQFRIYNPDLGNTGSNEISCYGGPNYSAGFSAPGGTDCVTGNSFLHPVDAHRPRTLQLGLKYNF